MKSATATATAKPQSVVGAMALADAKPYKAPKARIDWKVLTSVVSLLIAVATVLGSVELFRYLGTLCVDRGWAGCAQGLPVSMVVLGTATFCVAGMVLAATVLALGKAHEKLDSLIAPEPAS
ncbi:MAG: hypothetical protein CMK74_03770 [Pseudomonadales bacterium]|nr:hypothetical protein [Pseudomonadales bacterium]